jgi:hypothetical protein
VMPKEGLAWNKSRHSIAPRKRPAGKREITALLLLKRIDYV